MKPIVCALLLLVSTMIRSRVSLQLEIVALRHQIAVYQRTTKRPQINSGDRILWSWLSRHWPGWRDALVFVQTGTVIAWQRKRFRDHWAKLSKHGRPDSIRGNQGIDPQDVGSQYQLVFATDCRGATQTRHRSH